jgi:2-succinyl-5-enolpyruvyl-6-hydroxy-3-cyclohexene-1-carboxylate synthase
VLADALSPARHHAPPPEVVRVSAYDKILRDKNRARELAPQSVLCVGGWPASKVLRSWLEQTQPEILLAAPTVRNRDALHGRTRLLPGALAAELDCNLMGCTAAANADNAVAAATITADDAANAADGTDGTAAGVAAAAGTGATAANADAAIAGATADAATADVSAAASAPAGPHSSFSISNCSLRGGGGSAGDGAAYRDAWRRAEAAARAELDGALDALAPGDLFEPRAAHLLARHLPPGTPVFIANSMPVRDAEYFWPANDRRPRFYFNRGANGIDGTLSTALGIAHGNPRPAVLLTGDLSLLHDANGFLTGQNARFRGSLTIVLVNNRGGGIFEHLPVASFEPPFEDYFATPQRVDFALLCAAHGVEHIPVGDWVRFARLVSALPPAGVRVLEIRANRKTDAARRKALLDGAAGDDDGDGAGDAGTAFQRRSAP